MCILFVPHKKRIAFHFSFCISPSQDENPIVLADPFPLCIVLTTFEVLLNTSENKREHHSGAYFWYRTVSFGSIHGGKCQGHFSVRL